MRDDLLEKIIKCFIVALILLTPLINLAEIQRNTNLPLPNINIRKIKEFGMVFIIVLSFARTVVITKQLNKTYKYLFCIFGLLFIVLLCNINSNNLVLLCGFRWFLPFVMFVFVYDIVDVAFMSKVYKTMSIVFIIHIILQIYELFYMTPYLGTSFGGLAARVPGVMSLSHAAALFVCIFYLLLSKFESNNIIKFFYTILVIFSLTLLMSSTGLIVFCAIFSLRYFNQYLKNNKLLYLVLPFLLIIIYIFADGILGRAEGSSEGSLGSRIGLFREVSLNGSVFSSHFGYYTNAAIILAQDGLLKHSDIFWADSLFTSIIGNLGLFAFFVLLCLIVRIVFRSILNNHNYVLCWTVLFTLCSISTIITEIYPANIVISLVVAFIIKADDLKMYHYLS